MKKNIAIVLFLLFTALIVCAADETLTSPAYSGGATSTSTVGEICGTSTSTSYGLRAGLFGILYRSSPTTTLPPGVILRTNSAIYNVNQQALVVSFYSNQIGDHHILAGSTIVATQAVTATATYAVTALPVSLDLANQLIRTRSGTLCSNSISAAFNVQQLYLKPEGGIYQTNNITTYAEINKSTKIYFRLENKSNQPQIFVLNAAETGGTYWNNIYKDGNTTIAFPYQITIPAAGKYDNIYVDLSPASKAENLTIKLDFYQSGYSGNAITRYVYSQASMPPEGAVNAAIGSGKLFIEVSADGSSGASISSLSSTQEVTVKLYIFNLAGKLVHQEDLQVQAGPNIKDINMPTNLGKGTYIFQVVYNGKIISSGKFVNLN